MTSFFGWRPTPLFEKPPPILGLLAWASWLGLSTAPAVAAPPPATFSVLHHFSMAMGEARGPQATLLQAKDGFLYGTTPAGGSANQGVLFRLRETGADLQILHHFTKLAGDGGGAVGAVLQSREGTLFGTTESGGQFMMGAIYRSNRDGTGFAILKSFSPLEDARAPTLGLIEGTDGRLYGVADDGGTHNRGVIFSLAKDGNDYRILHHFQGAFSDGGTPKAPLMESKDGVLFGTTSAGGTRNRGTVFRIKKDGSDYRILRSFGEDISDAAVLLAPVVEDSSGMLFGMSRAGGGTVQGGAVFRMAKDGSAYKVLRAFTGLGGEPSLLGNGLLLANQRWILATSLSGGQHRRGTLFLLSKDGATLEVLHDFAGPPNDGTNPAAPLIQTGKNSFCSTTQGGGAQNAGTVYRLVVDLPTP